MMKSKKFIQTPSKILGIDPGYGRVGICIIEKSGSSDKLLHSECFETDSKLPHHQRLFLVAEKIKEIIEKYEPNKVAIETLLFSKNQKTALLVAEARGVILLESARKNIFVEEFNPNQVKLAITGYGKSDKKQITSMIKILLKMDSKKRHDDEFDAIAIALTSSAMSLSTDRAF